MHKLQLSEKEDRKEIPMPKVGGKHYAYTKKGETAARAAAKKSGKKLVRQPKKK